MAKNTFKPCPFCGGEARLLSQKYGYSVDCLVCNAMIRVYAKRGLMGWKQAVASWNVRK